ncbi:hypothetical protein K7X08_033881 [Anisodus acutangulus]|uniref:Uncharacterized protein n=1 Tax=Anisodus acutangulus TaxID=402998 RepID=A0A9Q1M7I5_9SOLA|nr:hypothetical protein K7X08_033881 [Anisodus acutangulus]
MLEEQASNLSNSYQESCTVRYNNLHREALKYVDEGAKDEERYKVAMDALREAANKVAIAKKTDMGVSRFSGPCRGESATQESHVNNPFEAHQLSVDPSTAVDEKEKIIQKLARKLERARRKCELYQANLMTILKDIEQQKLQLTEYEISGPIPDDLDALVWDKDIVFINFWDDIPDLDIIDL